MGGALGTCEFKRIARYSGRFFRSELAIRPCSLGVLYPPVQSIVLCRHGDAPRVLYRSNTGSMNCHQSVPGIIPLNSTGSTAYDGAEVDVGSSGKISVTVNYVRDG